MTFALSPSAPEVNEPTDLVLKLPDPPPGNPFTDASCTAAVSAPGEAAAQRVEGFCDDAAGRVFRLRFLPRRPGPYAVKARLQWGSLDIVQDLALSVRPSTRPGPVRIDPEHPFHFIREGTQEHFFPCGILAYWLLGWDENCLPPILDRLENFGVNRLRVALSGRIPNGAAWGEPLVRDTPQFRLHLEPWLAARPDDIASPGFDLSRFNLVHWRRAEHLLRLCQDRGMVVSLLPWISGQHPSGERAEDPGERLYLRYMAARLSAHPNVMWDLADEYQDSRDEARLRQTGAFLHCLDPQGPPIGCGGGRLRSEPWCAFTSFRRQDEAATYWPMLAQRQLQAASGRPRPLANESFGPEDQYPGRETGPKPPERDHHSRRKLAWDMLFAGCYCTAGERADRGTGLGEDSGGGWLNGRGDDSMVLLRHLQNLRRFFESFDWWETEPDPDGVLGEARLLAAPGHTYAAYLPGGGQVRLCLEPGTYRARWYACRSGLWQALPDALVSSAVWESPPTPDAWDWALLLERRG